MEPNVTISIEDIKVHSFFMRNSELYKKLFFPNKSYYFFSNVKLVIITFNAGGNLSRWK